MASAKLWTTAANRAKTAPVVTVFSSVSDITSNIEAQWPDGVLRVIRDSAMRGRGSDVIFDPEAVAAESWAQLAEAEILLSEPAILADVLSFHPDALPKLRWFQSTFAGLDPLFKSDWFAARPEFKETPPWIMTRIAGKFGPLIAEWVIGEIIAWERGFLKMRVDQSAKAWLQQKEVATYRTLSGLTIGILGLGDIGLEIARICKALGMTVLGMTNKPRPSADRRSCVDSYMTSDQLSQLLRSSDYVCNVLPSTAQTRGLLNGDALKVCSKKEGGKEAVFMNVGRGDVLTEASLVNALDKGWISAAILDVFEKEPLPSDSRLWNMENVIVSPHVSAVSRAAEVLKVMIVNYEKYVSGVQQDFVADWKHGY